jgi:hypothetical protein
MRAADMHCDVDDNTVGDESVEHRAVGYRHGFRLGPALRRPGERRCVGGGPSSGPSMSHLPEVPQQDDRATRDEQDHGVERQELSII